ncbi:site-specific DNA-methyltransferase [Planctomycetales bacterium ZRK34]|nr:site-specific DNA-methyltransferase [Planctomycetales bacterium ZRK34]
MIAHNRIYLKDAVEGMRSLPDASVDLIVTDPPYGIASSSRTTIREGKIVTTKKAFGMWDTFPHPLNYDAFIIQVLCECYRVLKPGGALYMFTASEQNAYFIRKAAQRGFTFRRVLCMQKKNPLPSFSKSNWRSSFDLCMYVVKGPRARTFNFISQHDCINVFRYAIRQAKLTTHPTEKPLAFIKRLIEVSSNPGELVLDPFMGSGTTAAAAKALGRNYLGFETHRDYVQMARKRLKGGAVRDTQRSKATA